jgi:iron-sulfur cluster assembly protein
MIRATEVAARHLHELLISNGKSTERDGLRLTVEKGGCAGLQYAMRIDTPHPGDEIVSQGGVIFIIDAQSLPYLENCQIDYEESLSDSGFRIHNPNAARSCGCGTSFEPATAAS